MKSSGVDQKRVRVLECAHPPAHFEGGPVIQKRQRTAAVQNLAEFRAAVNPCLSVFIRG